MSAFLSTIVVDNWYDNPDQIRNHAIKHLKDCSTAGKDKTTIEQMRERGNRWEPYPGWRTKAAVGNLIWNYDMISRCIGAKIDPKRWIFIPSVEIGTGDMQGMLQFEPKKNSMIVRNTDIEFNSEGVSNGTFACTFKDSIWRCHTDMENSYAAIVYLSPDAPVDSGTSFYKHIETGATSSDDNAIIDKEDYFDPSKWEEVDRIGNYYNRCVIFEASRYHCATKYFDNGTDFADGRVFQTFFFDIEETNDD